jgi:hypothetical protein
VGSGDVKSNLQNNNPNSEHSGKKNRQPPTKRILRKRQLTELSYSSNQKLYSGFKNYVKSMWLYVYVVQEKH